jgi:hypothetical protein
MVKMPRPFDKNNSVGRLYQSETGFDCTSLKIVLTIKAIEYVHISFVLPPSSGRRVNQAMKPGKSSVLLVT